MRGSNLKCGEDHPRAKVRNSDIYEIRKRYRTGEKQCCIAIEYGLCQSTISKIVNGVNWSHLEL